MAEKNAPIGWVPCPIKGCPDVADLFRFRERGDSERSIANRRFAGRLYCRCEDHGRMGGDPSDKKLQEYLLTEGHVWGPDEAREKPASAVSDTPAPLPAKTPTTPAPKPQAAPAKPPVVQPARQALAQGWPWD